MGNFLSLFISGGVTGAILSILAVGLVLTYATTGIFNFAHGAIAFVTAYTYYELNSALGWPVVPAALVSILVFAPLLGLALDRLLFRPLARTSETTKIVGTIGLLVALPAAFSFLIERLIAVFDVGLLTNELTSAVPGLGPAPKRVWHPMPGVAFDSDQLVVVLAAAVSAGCLWILLSRSRMGLAMRASVDSPSLSELRGVNLVSTSRQAWVIGSILAGLAGVVAAPNPAFGLNPNNYTLMTLVAAAAAILARLRSLPLAFAGGLLLGIIRNLVQGYVTWGASIPGLRSSTPFWLLFIALYFLARDRARRAGSVAAEPPPPDHLTQLPAWRRRLPWAIASTVLVLYTLFLADSIWQGIVARGLAMGIIFMSFTIVTGLGGMVSLAQASFVTSGALTTGLLINQGVPFLPAVIAGGLTATTLGVVVAMPSIRLGGLALALSTLALAYIGDQVLFQIDAYRNSAQGWRVHRPSIAGIDFSGDAAMALLLLAIALGIAWSIGNLQRSANGRSIIAVRTAQDAAAASGVVPTRVKLALFALSAFVAGIGGALFASVDRNITNFTWPPLVGLVWLAVTVTFGVRRPAAAIVAGMAFFVAPRIFSAGFHFPSWMPSFLSWEGTSSVLIPSILFGMGAIGLAKDPNGVLSTVGGALQHRRRRSGEPMPDDGSAPVVHEHIPTAEPVGADTTAGDDDAALVVRGLRGGYGDVEVLHGVDLAIPKGEILVLLGANGSGKSTLCKSIAGQITVAGGTVRLEGCDVAGSPAHARARQGLVLAPESRGVFPGLTVEDNLQLWLPDSTDRAAAYDHFPLLSNRRRLPAGNLSGGEQQMLTMAPLVVRPPKVLVADEPTLGLAPLVVGDVMRIFRDLAYSGVSLLLVEEKARDVLDIADHVAFIELGTIAWSGPRASVDDERLTMTYLGSGGHRTPERAVEGTR